MIRVAAPSAGQLDSLAAKYETLARLRRERELGREPAGRGELRALSRRFPGVLRELETLTLGEIDRRALELRAAAAGAAVQDWMYWVHGYHLLMRAALALKVRVAQGEAPSERLVRSACTDPDCAVDVEFARAVASPPNGKLTKVVLGSLAASFAVSPEVIRATLLPVLKKR